MTGLPFVVVYGGIIATLLVVVGTVAGMAWLARRPVRWAPRPGWRGLVVAAVASYGALFGLGRLLEATLDTTLLTVDEVLAALPGTRDHALTRIWIWHPFPSTEAGHAQTIALARLVDGCRGEARELVNADRFERAYDVALACDDRETAARAALALGHYDDAAQALSTSTNDADMGLAGTALIAAGRWAAAAALADRRAIAWKPDDQDWVTHLHCMAELFRAFGGDPRAADRLRATAQSTRSAACAYDAELAAHERADWLDRWFDDNPLEPAGQSVAADALRSPWENPWFVPFSLLAHDAPAYLRWRPVYHALLGDAAAVQHDVVAMRAVTQDLPLERALQVNLGAPIGARQLADPDQIEPIEIGFHHSDDQLEATLRPADKPAFRALQYLSDPVTDETELAQARRDAMTGDSRALVALLPTLGARELLIKHPRYLTAALPYIVGERAELRAAVRALTAQLDHHWWVSSWSVVELAQVAADRRDLMRASGNVDLAARWQAIFDRHARALGDPARIHALMLWR